MGSAGPVARRPQPADVVLPVAGVIAGLVLVLGLQALPPWHAFADALLAIDFDQERTAMLQSLAAGMLVAAVGTALTARPFLCSVATTAFVFITYAGPLGPRLTLAAPVLLGVQEQVVASTLRHNQLVIVALAFLSAVPAAAVGHLVQMAARGAAGRGWSWRPRASTPGRALAGSLLVLTASASTALALTGADPLLRFGPSHGVFHLPPPVAQPAPRALPSAPTEVVPATGQVLSMTYSSAAMGEDRHYLIYLPPTYGLKSARIHRYPVVYLLHGDPSAPDEWIGNGAPALLDSGIARHMLPETILVMPDGNGRVTYATWWADRADGRDRIESALLELVDVVDREYRTLRDPGHRVIAGLSSGGFGAANIAARHPDRFGTAMSFGGTFFASGLVFGSNAAQLRANSPYYIVEDQPAARSVRFILVVGLHDWWRKAATEQFARQLTRLSVPHELDYLPGGHGPEVWVAGLALGMEQIAADLYPPSPAHARE